MSQNFFAGFQEYCEEYSNAEEKVLEWFEKNEAANSEVAEKSSTEENADACLFLTKQEEQNNSAKIATAAPSPG
ncbi:hypothetical protein [Piscirickettsia litoralis]|uniref:Uncharacterized protein n=1 Tax=Piscirickettsia litoralis TaxID=1891921 RepID=A0ABX2ZYL6_9GAMM|nr:hypothetical protein [Piscirickettsia litoralis]ODN41608.1 hypothetical protein BGC07_16055 [Piscirickettsia litoralis]